MSEATDPLALNVSLDDVDTGRPVVAPGVYAMKIGNVEVVDNKAGTGRNLIVDFELIQPAQSTKDAVINPGFRIRNYYPLQPSEKNPESDLWKQQLARLQDAVMGTSIGNRGAFNPYDFREKQVLVDVSVETSDEYGDQNRVKRLMRLEEQ